MTDLAIKALRLHVAYEAVPQDRGGRTGTKGTAWSAFIKARDAALTAALEGSVAVPAWQPIETAPKDKYILAIRMEWWETVNGDHRWTYSRIRETNWMVGSERWDFGCEKQPTHWMPRPAFPRQDRGGPVE